MPQVIDIPGHGQVEFPDGMSDDQIVSAIHQLTSGAPAATVVQPKPAADKPGMLQAIGNGIVRGGYAIPGMFGLDAAKAQGIESGVRALLKGQPYGPAADQQEAAMRQRYARTEADYPITTGLAVGVGSTPSMALAGQVVPMMGAVPAAEAAAARSGIPLLVRNAPLLGRAAGGSVNAAGGGLALGIGASNETDPLQRIREGLGTAAGGAALGWLAPLKPPVLAERATLQATDALERKVAERGLQAISGGRGNAKRLSRTLAQEDPNRPVQVGLEAFRSTDLPAGYQTPDQIAAALAKAETAAGQNLGEVYGAATSDVVPISAVRRATVPKVEAIDRPATRAAAADAKAYLEDAIATARRDAEARLGLPSPPEAPKTGHSHGKPAAPEAPALLDPYGRTAVVTPEPPKRLSRLSPADLHRLRVDMDTKARGWAGTGRPQETAAADAINQARGALNQEVLQPAMDQLNLGLEARAADARFGRVADAARIAKASNTGGLFAAEDAMSQAERVLSPAGSLAAQTGEAFAGRPGQAAMGALSTLNKATLNNPRWTQRQGRSLYNELLKAYQGSPGAPPPTAPSRAAAMSPEMQALINAMFGRGSPGMAVPVPADDREAMSTTTGPRR